MNSAICFISEHSDLREVFEDQRKKLGMSYRQVGQISGCAASAYWQWVVKGHEPKISTILKYANTLQVSLTANY